MNTEITKHQIMKNMREYLIQNGYVEVVTSVIREHDSLINSRFALKNGKFLRDCMELSLRKKVSRVCPKVFEIGPCFRQDKEDDSHRQEFSMLELYSKDEKLEHMIKLMSGIITACMSSVIDVEEVSVRDFILSDLSIDIAKARTEDLVSEIIRKHPVVHAKDKPLYVTVNNYIERFVETSLARKGCLYFLYDYPYCTISIANRKDRTNCIQRFECFVNGLEVSNAFEDCMDAEDIENRIKESDAMGCEEQELVNLVRTGNIPATVGLGVGIDRLCMLST